MLNYTLSQISLLSMLYSDKWNLYSYFSSSASSSSPCYNFFSMLRMTHILFKIFIHIPVNITFYLCVYPELIFIQHMFRVNCPAPSCHHECLLPAFLFFPAFDKRNNDNYHDYGSSNYKWMAWHTNKHYTLQSYLIVWIVFLLTGLNISHKWSH